MRHRQVRWNAVPASPAGPVQLEAVPAHRRDPPCRLPSMLWGMAPAAGVGAMPVTCPLGLVSARGSGVRKTESCRVCERVCCCV